MQMSCDVSTHSLKARGPRVALLGERRRNTWARRGSGLRAPPQPPDPIVVVYKLYVVNPTLALKIQGVRAQLWEEEEEALSRIREEEGEGLKNTLRWRWQRGGERMGDAFLGIPNTKHQQTSLVV